MKFLTTSQQKISAKYSAPGYSTACQPNLAKHLWILSTYQEFLKNVLAFNLLHQAEF
jgi:hypothetical protein